MSVSIHSASGGKSPLAVEAGQSTRSASTAHTPYCQRGESLSRSSHFMSSSTAAAMDTVSV